MPRDIPVGNGKLLITFDSQYRLRDIYYPHVGKENHTEGHPFRFGVWVEGKFSWVGSSGWDITKTYLKNTLITDVQLKNKDLKISLHCHDAVDFFINAYLKKIIVCNLADRQREIRFFFNHDFCIYGNNIGDTAVYDPASRTIIHYKNKRYFIIGGCCKDVCGIADFATGIKGTKEKEGTWRDAEDGTLSGNPIAQGSVDSTISMNINLKEGEESYLHYWIAAGKNKHEVLKINESILRRSPENLIKRTGDYWRFWLEKEDVDFDGLSDPISSLYNRSLLTLRTQIDSEGAIIAANDTDILQFAKDTYSYMWPRDGALVANALDLAGYSEVTRQFFKFCEDVVTDEGYFLHKYNPDRSVASSWHPWEKNGIAQLPIQEDETALVIWALWKHFEINRDIEFIKPLYKKVIKNCADFMVGFRDKKTGLPLPSYDLWEERQGIHTFTAAAVYSGLIAAANFTEGFGEQELTKKYKKAAEEIRTGMDTYLYSSELNRFLRMINISDGEVINDYNIDASMYALFALEVYDADDPRIISTMDAIKSTLWCKTDVGGLARYENDYYHQISQDIKNVPGNPWFICTLWLAEFDIARAKSIKELEKTLDILDWVTSRALPSGILSEQVHPYDDTPLSVSPLTWSHAEFVSVVLKYLEKRKKLEKCPKCGKVKPVV